ncbi:S8/S53 family peptidase [Pseudomonas sp. RAC1]|uniref:S8/S53 family peptidase n=1 Tax=Pseudomonas sp. RAC1 TaxID=3064900 RepID=UPI00271CCA27|nr:S8/S53 family peptidase [Pseudomonas sp. RAC1]MDV9034436.1 S8/S53 family peptidase [Pseudomonas sp. RAC1]
MKVGSALLFTGLLWTASIPVLAAETLRITSLMPCTGWHTEPVQRWCMGVQGLSSAKPAVVLDGAPLADTAVVMQPTLLHVSLPQQVQAGVPVWLSDGDRVSNMVRWNPKGARVLPLNQDRLEDVAPGVVTAVDLLSLVLKDEASTPEAALRIASRHGLQIVGAITALGVYQVRLPADGIVTRQAWIEQLQADPQVAAIVIEDDNRALPEDPDDGVEPADQAGWEANHFSAAVDLYQRTLATRAAADRERVRVGIVERGVDFDSLDFRPYAKPCAGANLCVYAYQSPASSRHGSVVTGILASSLYPGGNRAFLSRLSRAGGRFDLIIDRGSPSGVIARIAASVNMVQDGAQVLNWSWGIHRLGTLDREGEPVAVNVRSEQAFAGYRRVLERFFVWLEREHPGVVVVNSAGNSAGDIADHLPAALRSPQLLVVGAHQRSAWSGSLTDVRAVQWRESSNRGPRVDIAAAACPGASLATAARSGRGGGCGTSYAAALVTGTVAALLSIDPGLTPLHIKALLREGALPLAHAADASAGQAPRTRLRLDMQRTLALAIERATARSCMPAQQSAPVTSPDQ